MSENYENKEPEVLAAWYGQKTFVKVKQVLEIGKILFSFVNMENSSENIDCYMLAEEFGALLMADIKTRLFFRQLAEEKAKGDQYPKPIWTSPIGGSETGGKTISRYFNIAPGSKTEVVLTALCFPADKNSTGAFIQKQGAKPLCTLRVPCTNNDLKLLQYKWSFLEADYMSKKYSVENTTSEYYKKQKEQPKNTNTSKPANANAQTEETEKENAPHEVVTDLFKTKNIIADRRAGGKYIYACRKNDQKPVPVVFLDEQTEKDSKWNDFVEKAAKKTEIQFRIKYTERNGTCYFIGFC